MSGNDRGFSASDMERQGRQGRTP
ncbi:hypothetical protein CCP3SC1AL1_110013 [Gammaproteobacteria bacterium]